MTRADAFIPYGREVVQMSSYEIIIIILTVINLLILSGEFLLALLNYLDKRNNKRKKIMPLSSVRDERGGSH